MCPVWWKAHLSGMNHRFGDKNTCSSMWTKERNINPNIIWRRFGLARFYKFYLIILVCANLSDWFVRTLMICPNFYVCLNLYKARRITE